MLQLEAEGSGSALSRGQHLLEPNFGSPKTVIRLKRCVEDDPAQTLLLSFKRLRGEHGYFQREGSGLSNNEEILSSVLNLAATIPAENNQDDSRVAETIVAAVSDKAEGTSKYRTNVKRRINRGSDTTKENFRQKIVESRFKAEFSGRMLLKDFLVHQNQQVIIKLESPPEEDVICPISRLIDQLKIARDKEEVVVIDNHASFKIPQQQTILQTIQTVFHHAQEQYHNGNYANAELHCKSILEYDPQNESALLMLSAIYLQMKKLADSASNAMQVIFQNPLCAEAYSNLGNAYFEQDSLEEAVDCYSHAIHLKPTFLAGYLNLGTALAKADSLNDAINIYNSALSLNPNWFEVRRELGNLFFKLDKIPEALDCYYKILAINPDDAMVINSIGSVYFKLHKFDTAKFHFESAIAKSPLHIDSYINLAKIWSHTGTTETSSKDFFESKQPVCSNSNLLVHIGIIFQTHSYLDLSMKAYKRAIHLNSSNFIAWSHLSNVLCEKMEFEEAARCLEVVLCGNPNDSSSLNNLANIKRQQGLNEEAMLLYRKALELYPQFASAHSNYGLMLHCLGHYADAVIHMKEAIKYEPNFASGYFNLGNVLRDMNNYDGGLQCYTAAIQLDSSHAESYASIAAIHKEHGNVSEAIQLYQKALSCKPDLTDASYQLFHCCLMVCDWTNYDEKMANVFSLFVEQLEKKITPSVHPHHCMLFPLTREQTRQVATSYAQLNLNKIEFIPKKFYHHSCPREENEKLRIGYVSYDFGNHPTSHLMQSIPGCHNRELVEVYCYALNPDDGTKFRENIVQTCDHFVDLSDIRCNGKAAERIFEDRIHILVNLNGYTKGGREEIFALQPAPIQVMWLGYPSTSGAPYMQYIITDETTTPMDFADQFTEKLAYMPYSFFIGDHKQMFPHVKERVVLTDKISTIPCPDNVIVINASDLSPVIKKTQVKELIQLVNPFCWDNFPNKISVKVGRLPTPVEEMVRTGNEKATINGLTVENGITIKNNYDKASRGEEVPKNVIVTCRSQYGLPADGVVYCNFNQLYKIDPKICKSWMKILKKVPNSVLWLLRFPHAGEANILQFAASSGVDTSRIIFSDVVPKEEHVRRGQLADICLDTPLCNGHTTSMDVLWAGTPVITLPGESFASRVAASQLVSLDCRELIVHSYEHYENIAISIGSNEASLRTVRAKVWEARTTRPLFDVVEYTSNLEKLYVKMWERHEGGLNPDHITELSYLRV